MPDAVWRHRRAWTRPRVPTALARTGAANRKAPGVLVGVAAETLRRTPPGRPPRLAAADMDEPFPIDLERRPAPFPPPFASAWGDDVHGLWADLRVTSERETAVQRLRWIEPGTFLMGSPQDEPERDADEGPQHLVTLARGFWLADTACTQALWEAVTGDNPSHFKGADRPVEQVSWNDVGTFLEKLEALVPGCRAELPTEAEWEYACRAGTMTPFSFGETITPEQVNYDGKYPYAGGKKGLYRKETVAVKSLPPNPWGLYEIHGNVWEWCADGLRKYEQAPAVDPGGPEDKEAHRACPGRLLGRLRQEGAFRLPHRDSPGLCVPPPGLSPVPEVQRARFGSRPARRAGADRSRRARPDARGWRSPLADLAPDPLALRDLEIGPPARGLLAEIHRRSHVGAYNITIKTEEINNNLPYTWHYVLPRTAPHPRKSAAFRPPRRPQLSKMGITVAEVRSPFDQGETDPAYPHDLPYPRRLLVGSISGRALPVVIAEDADDDEHRRDGIRAGPGLCGSRASTAPPW